VDRDEGLGATGPDDQCTLLSITCTTGGFDWVHGDLWLCPDGILRRSRGWRVTLRNTGSMGIKDAVDWRNRPTRIIAEGERRQIASVDKRNWWVPWDQISRAKLSSGPLSYGLHLELTDGRKEKFEWLRQDGPADVLMATMTASLGERMTA
jgi:hypothetical protein